MQFGICCGPELVTTAAELGYDYFEWTVGGLLKPLEGEEAFAAAWAAVRAAPLPCPAVNCFLPPELKVTGPSVNAAVLDRYAATACRRAKTAGVRVIVFGSGAARRIPEGFDPRSARAQVVAFCSRLGPIAQSHGVTIAVEPLNRQECNLLTSVTEAAEVVREVNHPAIRLLADAYHMLRDQEPLTHLAPVSDLLCHIHMATVPHRWVPGSEPCDLSSFVAALRATGYDGRVSIEAQLRDARSNLQAALAYLRQLCA